MDISKELKKQAVSLGLCKEWTEDWDNYTIDELIEKYKKGIDFCIERNWPDNEFVKTHLSEIAESHGIFTDKEIVLCNFEWDDVVFNGNCKADVSLSGYLARTIYVRHNSILRLNVSEKAIVFVRAYDNARIIVENHGDNKCFVYLNDRSDCEKCGNVLIRDKK